MKTFPPPLTADEETYYLQKYIEGDLEAKHILIERNLRLVAHVLKKYQCLEEDMDDLLSIGTIGLIKAIDSYDISKGKKLTTLLQSNPEGKIQRLSTYCRCCL